MPSQSGNTNFSKARSVSAAWRRNSTQGLLTFREDVTASRDSRHAFDWDPCEEITILEDLLKKLDFIYLFFKKLDRHLAGSHVHSSSGYPRCWRLLGRSHRGAVTAIHQIQL